MTRAAKGSERTPTPLPEFLRTQRRSALQAIVAMYYAGAYRLASLVSPSLTRPAIIAFDGAREIAIVDSHDDLLF